MTETHHATADFTVTTDAEPTENTTKTVETMFLEANSDLIDYINSLHRRINELENG